MALLACLFISLIGAPLGVILVLRRMSMTGEALSHAILPGLAVALFVWGVWLPGMTLGGLIAGLIVSFLSHGAAKRTKLRDDATLASFYVIALALGIFILSLGTGTEKHAIHLLFGSILGVDAASLNFIMAVSLNGLIVFLIIYRPLVYDCFDPIFSRSVGIKGGIYTNIFLMLVVCVLVAACQALGTLMAIGLMIIPSVTACLLSNRIKVIMVCSVLIAFVVSYGGLLFSFHYNWPSGCTIILGAGILYGLVLGGSALKESSLWRRI